MSQKRRPVAHRLIRRGLQGVDLLAINDLPREETDALLNPDTAAVAYMQLVALSVLAVRRAAIAEGRDPLELLDELWDHPEGSN